MHWARSSIEAAPAKVLFAVTAASVWVFCAGPAGGQSKAGPPKARPQEPVYKSPTCVAFSPDGRFAFVTNHTANKLVLRRMAAKRKGWIKDREIPLILQHIYKTCPKGKGK